MHHLLCLYGPIKRSSKVACSAVITTCGTWSPLGCGGAWIDTAGADWAGIDWISGTDNDGDADVDGDDTGTVGVEDVGNRVGKTIVVVETDGIGRTRFRTEEFAGIDGNGFGFFADTTATKIVANEIDIFIEVIFKLYFVEIIIH